VVGLYQDAATAEREHFEPGILNPGEEIVVRLRALPPVGPNTTNRAAISPANGVGTSILFTR